MCIHNTAIITISYKHIIITTIRRMEKIHTLGQDMHAVIIFYMIVHNYVHIRLVFDSTLIITLPLLRATL